MVGYVSTPVPDDGFIKRLNLVVQFGQRKVLSGNTSEIYGPSVCITEILVRIQASIFSFMYFCVSSTNTNSVG